MNGPIWLTTKNDISVSYMTFEKFVWYKPCLYDKKSRIKLFDEMRLRIYGSQSRVMVMQRNSRPE